jgi:ADP-heptose:LPS heptosyltransferase
MHLAASVGINVVSIFGGKDPVGKWYPINNNDGVISPPPQKSIDLITPDAVMLKVDHYLKKLNKSHDS